ncbi:MAG: transposase [Pirellulaceae bacterium]
MGRNPKVPRDVQRQIVQQLLRGDESIAALARKHRVSDQTLYRWQRQYLAESEDTLPAESSDSGASTTQGFTPEVYDCELDSFLRQCPECGSNMTADYRNRRTVILPTRAARMSRRVGLILRLSLRIRRCHNSSCNRFLAPYRPEAEGRIAFPNQKLSLPLLRHVHSIHEICRTIRKTQARLSGGGINLAHATVEKAVKLTRRFRKTEPLEDVREFLQTHPHQKYVLLDIFSWRRSYGDHSGWMARDCLSGDVVVQPTLKLVHVLWSVFPDFPIPILGVLSPTNSTVAIQIRRDLQQSTLRQFPLPQALSVLPKELLRTLGLPVCYVQLLPTL